MLKHKTLLKINVLFLILIGAIGTYLDRKVHIDDALIYYRYIYNFINGNGLVYNIGERFNALTSPLYIYISILISSITREVEITQVCLSGVLLISSAILISLIFYKQENIFIGILSSVVFISSKFFYLTFGLETNLFILLLLLCIYFYLEKKYITLSIVSAFLVLTRGEGLLLLFVLLYFNFSDDKKLFKFYYLIPIFVTIIIELLVNYYYYNQILPHTLFAKIDQGKSGFWGDYAMVINIQYLTDMFFNKEGVYIYFVTILFIIGLINFYKNIIIKILLLYISLVTLFYLIINVPNYHWYYSVHFLTLYILVGVGLYRILLLLSNSSSWNPVKKLITIMILIYLTSVQIRNFHLLNEQKPALHYQLIGEWIDKNTPVNSKIASVEIGHIGWYSHRYLVDILGLVNPHNANYLGNKKFDNWFFEYKPDYVVVHNPAWAPGQEQTIIDLKNQELLVEDTTFKMQGFKILKIQK